MIEPTNICNLRCPLCPSGNGSLQRSRGYMDFQHYRKIIDEVKHYAAMICLWNQGESFLHRDFYQMIAYASQAGLFTLASSNANVPMEADALIKTGLDSLIISLDGATQETYNRYRINGKLATVLENVRNIVAAKNKLNSRTPFLRWQFLILKHNEHEIEKIRALAKQYEIDHLEFKTAQIYNREDIENFLPRDHKLCRYKVENGNFELKVGIRNRCRRIWTSPTINWDGEVSICCFDKDLDFPLGNIIEKNLLDIWKSAKVNHIRQRILRDRGSIPICCNCGEGVKLRIESRDL
ncbi:MAG: SPASM domain-containing protein [Candidatus Cloacimonetes bacterium]|nr:SPASM domain-containing protein [Candidatus Cloacimonadota bacterium]